jgi:hypothetical protein
VTQGYVIREIHHFVRSCFECEFYQHRMMKSGQHPEYRDSCTHPQAVKDYYGNCSYEDREIREKESPSWCPVGERQKDGE